MLENEFRNQQISNYMEQEIRKGSIYNQGMADMNSSYLHSKGSNRSNACISISPDYCSKRRLDKGQKTAIIIASLVAIVGLITTLQIFL